MLNGSGAAPGVSGRGSAGFAPVLGAGAMGCTEVTMGQRFGGRACAAGAGVAAVLVGCGAAAGQALPAGFAWRNLGTGLASPTAMAVRPDGSILIAQKTGTLRLYTAGALQAGTIHTFPSVASGGEGGLIGLCVDPDFAGNGYVYARVTRSGTAGGIVRVQMDGNAVVAGSETMIFPLTGSNSIHLGGAVKFALGGKLVFAVGEGCGNEQLLDNLCGKLLRTEADGTPCADNPHFLALTGSLRAIYCRGLRNPFTIGVHPLTGAVLINDVGSSFEEINAAVDGANYGYPTTNGPFNQAQYPQFTQPLYSYPTSGSAITGGAFYLPQTAQFPAEYRGKYFFGDYVDSFVRTLDAATGVATPFGTAMGQPVGYEVTPDGRLLVLGFSGRLIEVTYTLGACCTGTACAVGTAAACAGAFQGLGTACGPAANPTTCCPANYDGQNGVDLLDIFAFLEAWFAGCEAAGPAPCVKSADFNGQGGVELLDIFAFLGAWFTGCG